MLRLLCITYATMNDRHGIRTTYSFFINIMIMMEWRFEWKCNGHRRQTSYGRKWHNWNKIYKQNENIVIFVTINIWSICHLPFAIGWRHIHLRMRAGRPTSSCGFKQFRSAISSLSLSLCACVCFLLICRCGQNEMRTHFIVFIFFLSANWVRLFIFVSSQRDYFGSIEVDFDRNIFTAARVFERAAGGVVTTAYF